MIVPFRDKQPVLGEGVFLAPDAWVIGDVTLGEQSSVFFGAVLRGDLLGIRVGRRSNIQEHSVIHTSHDRHPVIIGEEVTVGHRVTIHGASVGNRVIVGMGSTLLDDAKIPEECIIGAGTLITEGKEFPPRSLILGSPGRAVRPLRDEEIEFLRFSAAGYVETAGVYRAMNLGR